MLALRARRDVERICRRLLEALPEAKADTPPDVATRLRWERYWVLATLRETAVALGDPAAAAGWERQAAPYADAPWMIRSTEDQIARLAPLLADPPTSRVR